MVDADFTPQNNHNGAFRKRPVELLNRKTARVLQMSIEPWRQEVRLV